MKVVALAGGVGAGKFLRGLVRAVPPRDVTAVVNTGDDLDMHGLRVCPDLDSVTYVADNLDLKERQMNSALTGVPMRARNVNLPVLSTMTEWLSALQQLVWKYRYIEIERDQRPWYLAGKNEEVASVLARMRGDLDVLEARSEQVLRDVARELINKEQLRHSLIVAQAEEGIADALFQERAQR